MRLSPGHLALPLGLAVAAATATVAAAGAFTGATSAAPGHEIVVRGAASGSHLRIGVERRRIVVHGYLAAGRQRGCRVTRRRQNAVCRVAGADRMVVKMGPSNDKVEVLDRLPFPLIAHLGRGSDKLIGGGERDVCYPEGTRRNRCVGGGGNDVCITGPKNTDCVGGPGNDYCRAGSGSDGCWGGPGRDVCLMGPGHDGCHGDGGRDRLYGGPSSDQLYGGRGRDYCNGGRGVGRSHSCETGPGR